MFQKLSKNNGFSLVELLIYMGILGAVSGILVGVLTTVTKTQIEESVQTEISGQLNFTMQTIQRLVKNSSLVDADAGTTSSTITLRTQATSTDPTTIYLSSGRIYVKEGADGTPQSITSDKVTVDSLEFKKLTQYPGKDIVQIDLAMSGVTQVEGKIIGRVLRSAISRVSAATFDSDLVPGSDNTYSVGTSNRWKNGIFSGNVGIGVSTLLNKLDVSGGTAIGTYAGSATAPSNGLIVRGNVGIGTTNPLQKLQIGDNSVAALGLRIAATGVNWDQVTNASSSLTIGSGAGVYLTFNKDSPYYSSFNLGNVGIGTTTPTTAGLVIATQVGTTTLDVTGGKIINLGTPVNSTDAATKAYADTAGGGSDEAVVGRGPISATFARSSVAYKQNGTSVASGAPRYETAKYSNGITVEEGVTNPLLADTASMEANITYWASEQGGGDPAPVWDATDGWTGTHSVKQVSIALDDDLHIITDRKTAAPGEVWTSSAWVKCEAGKTLNFYVDWRNGATILPRVGVVVNCTGSWQWAYETGTAPATTNQVGLSVRNGYNGAHTFKVDGAQVVKMAYPVSFQLPGTSRVAETLTIPGTIVNNSTGTFDAWVKFLRAPGASGTWYQFILYTTDVSNNAIRLFANVTDGKLGILSGYGTGYDLQYGTTVLQKDTLYHVAVTWDATATKVYLNGSLEITSAHAPVHVPASTVYIGSTSAGTNVLDGIMETPRFFSSALSGPDILKAANRASFTSTP